MAVVSTKSGRSSLTRVWNSETLSLRSCTAPLTVSAIAVGDDMKVVLGEVARSSEKDFIGAVFSRCEEGV